ncbi:MAG: hypothetical protein QXR14_06430 [Sulfolobales archaeon]
MGSTAQAVREARTVWDLGYHAGLLSFHMPKGYSEDMILEHAKTVAKEIPISGFYLQPAVGGIPRYRFWSLLRRSRTSRL